MGSDCESDVALRTTQVYIQVYMCTFKFNLDIYCWNLRIIVKNFVYDFCYWSSPCIIYLHISPFFNNLYVSTHAEINVNSYKNRMPFITNIGLSICEKMDIYFRVSGWLHDGAQKTLHVKGRR